MLHMQIMHAYTATYIKKTGLTLTYVNTGLTLIYGNIVDGIFQNK